MAGWGTTMVGYGQTVGILNSLRMEFGDGVMFVAGPTVKYAVHHERGTSKMEARPFARPAAERVQANLTNSIGEFLDTSLTRASEEAVVRGAALSVEKEMKRIVKAKGIWDTGTLHASISVERVR